ncbi:hypothetical protein [uncultured Sulfitobacter sp.]|uniref:hypothetical protein n=1 Tax=uncultured Sulfitobacter sp. TaxID=191468 RepID=UPI00260724C7|nr:hypothetical protein [uncultured Sulfitobacter sp.]
MHALRSLTCSLVIAGLLAACSETVATADGAAQNANASAANASSAREVVASQSIPIKAPSARYKGAIAIGEVTGFVSPGVFPGQFSPVTDDETRRALTGLMRDTGYGPGNRYILSVRLAEPGNPTGATTMTANALLEFTLRTADGRTIKTQTLRSKSSVPFGASISGAARSKLAFALSLRNSAAKFLNGLG